MFQRVKSFKTLTRMKNQKSIDLSENVGVWIGVGF